MMTDADNLKKIETYLEKYGHPNKLDHGNKAFYAPWIVLHHADSENPPRRRNFKYLYEYYKKEELEADRLAFFMSRWYNREFGHRIKWDRPFTSQEELDSMVNALNLRTIANEIDNQMDN